ncbi:MAG: hypothetical protein ACFFDK_15185 [Promethearchaeota archaeon]
MEYLKQLNDLKIENGIFIPISSGIKYSFHLLDINQPPMLIEKTYDGKLTGARWQFAIEFMDFEITTRTILYYIKMTNEKNHGRIPSIKGDNICFLELGNKASQKFAQFLVSNFENLNTHKFTMEKLGGDFSTDYKFELRD